MTTRSRQAAQLARILTSRTGHRVTLTYLGTGSDRAYSGWHVQWCDGPTHQEMRDLVAVWDRQVPAIARADLRYDRTSSDRSRAVALLRHLNRYPELAVDANTFTVDVAFDETSYPEKSDPVWVARAAALAATDSHGYVTGDVVGTLAEQARQRGWPGVLAWLDAMVAATEDPNVVDLREARQRRQGENP